jgi:glycolate oxidase
MKRIFDIDYDNRGVHAEAGVVNLHISNATRPCGYHYAPDPSSQMACTIGGNAATNSGGPHTLKYGVTVNHVLGLTLVLPDGEIVTLGGKAEDTPGYDLVGAIVGNEGTFGIITEVVVRLTRNPTAYRTMLGVFDSIDDATNTVSDIIGAGIVPAALELMDNLIINAVEDAYGTGFPRDAEAVLIIELDGLEAGLDRLTERVIEICNHNYARQVRQAATDQERADVWKARKRAFGAVGRLSPSYCTQDGVVPRTRLPEILRFIRHTSERHDIRIANVFHAGDGNIHPLLLFDERDQAEVKRVLAAADEILDECVRLGGSVSGEHGIGVEKIAHLGRMFSADDLAAQAKLRAAFDPDRRANPNKMFSSGIACGEAFRPKKQAPA